MYLKKLKMQGFKSFPEKVSLQFDRGICAVVGPNGSGKSNISDAVRWALGEQSMKSLRGAKMEDIIFSGTQSRKPLNFAEVTLVIDNSDLALPLDFTEITVTRRAYRSGESQFFINNSPVRLKDIHELFFDTGIGREGYSIIGQGKIDEILSSRSEDRRNLFEEAAGIVKYRTRRAEAFAKLEREAQNLIRINDIISEIEAQLVPLFQHAEMARKFIKLSERLKIVEINSFVNRVKKIQSDIEKFDGGISGLSESIGTVQSEQNKNKLAQEELSKKYANSEEAIAKTTQAHQDMLVLLEKNEGDIRLIKQQIEFFQSESDRLKNEIANKTLSTEELEQKKSNYLQKLSDTETEKEKKLLLLSSKQAEQNAVSQAITSSEELLEKYSSQHMSILQQTSDMQAGIQHAHAKYEQLENRMEDLEDEQEEATQAFQKLIDELKKNEDILSTNSEHAKKLNQDLSLHMQEKDRLETEKNLVSGKLASLTSSVREHSSRRKLLLELEASFEGYGKGVKAILTKRDKHELRGIHGAVGELVGVGEKYTAAIETALGSAMQNIIVQSETDAQNAIEYLKRTKEGRVTFLPIESVNGKSLPEKDKLMSFDGFLGIARELISCDDRYDGVFSSLLGRVVVIDTLDNAIAFCRRNSYKYKTVTLDGELLNIGGSITGGASAYSPNILSRRREIEKLEYELALLEKDKAKLETELNNSEMKRYAVAESIEKIKYRVREAELQENTEKINRENLLKQQNLLKEKIDAQRIEHENLITKLHDANSNIRELQKKHDQTKLEIDEILKTVENRKNEIKESRKLLETKQKELASAKTDASVLAETINSIAANINRLDMEIALINESADKSAENIEQLNRQTAEKLDEIKRSEQANSELEKSCADVKAKLAKLSAEKDSASVGMSELRESYEELAETLSSLNSDMSRLEVKKEQTELDMKKLYDDMWEKYNVTYHTALSAEFEQLDMSPLALQREEATLKNEIKSIGTVNVSAIEEYEALNERCSFMRKQRDDIQDAEKKLRGIISDLAKLMEKQFDEQLLLISESFNKVFSEMFEGGQAYLKLQDPENVLESGIDIIAQPPGKNLQNMLLFSGGERALTAITLLFAILRLKPSPFCVLDEIEAALDDANVARFANYIKKSNLDTQFILITHRKGTMEAADVLYGVTMHELGVSKMVSVNLSDS